MRNTCNCGTWVWDDEGQCYWSEGASHTRRGTFQCQKCMENLTVPPEKLRLGSQPGLDGRMSLYRQAAGWRVGIARGMDGMITTGFWNVLTLTEAIDIMRNGLDMWDKTEEEE